MKKALAVALAAVLVGISSGGALAQLPYVQVYFDDPNMNETQSNCRPAGSNSSLWVVAQNLNAFVQAVDFKVQFPPALLYDSEAPQTGVSDLVIGTSPTGMAISYNLPANGFGPLALTRVIVEWTNLCNCAQGPQPVRVVGFDDIYSPTPKAVRFPSGEQFDLVGMTSLICPGFVATEPKTWGGVKALYR